MSTAAINEALAQGLASGATLEELDRDLIEPAPLDDEERAAAWLFAWVCSDEPTLMAAVPGLAVAPD